MTTYFNSETRDAQIMIGLSTQRQFYLFAGRSMYRKLVSIDSIDLILNAQYIIDYYAQSFQTRMTYRNHFFPFN